MTRKPARPSSLFDRYRAEALQGITHRELDDADREWIWRSLLKGVRRKQALLIANLKPEQVPAALERVKRWYRQRSATYKREHPQRPQVVRPVMTPPKRQGGFLGLGGNKAGS